MPKPYSEDLRRKVMKFMKVKTWKLKKFVKCSISLERLYFYEEKESKKPEI
ncbi:hypothetical protein [Spiroplasma endosymbiont of Dasysyrphus albostriatus]|uniref:hypothetical protein n=1 Tax=Spiroplasma endosymbiont of Dasysyrphus albostriatus TaxID=3066299 RepID=UPI003BB0AD1C